MSELIGKQLGPYRIVEQVGAGGMATVYKAHHAATDRHVAVKVLPEQMAANPELRQRFEREAKVIASLEHTHILPVYDSGEAANRLYLVMRYIEAGTLKDRIRAEPMDLADVSHIFRQVGSALDYAHRLGIVHRDVKPSNVLIDSEGSCFLTDFGLAKIIEASVKLTATGVGIGTPDYMSPEQGQGDAVDERSDIYSLGVVLYEMIAGQTPYQAETPLAVVLMHINDPLPPIKSVRPDVPDAVEQVIGKAMAKKPKDRFQTVREMMDAFEEAVGTAVSDFFLEPLPAATTSAVTAPSAPRRTVATWRWVAIGAAALCVLCLAGLVGAYILLPKGDGKEVARQTETSTTPQLTATPATVPSSTPMPLARALTATPTPPSLADAPTTTSTSTSSPAPSPTPSSTPTKDSTPPEPTLPVSTWQRIDDLPRQLNAIVADPTNPEVLYAGTGDNGSGSGVYKSEDGGLTWRLAVDGLPADDVKALALDPSAPSTLYALVGVRGDIYVSADAATSWTRVGDSELFGGFEHALYVVPGDRGLLFALARSDALVRSRDGGQTWVPVGGGLPDNGHGGVAVMSLAIAPTEPNVIYAGTGAWVGGGRGVFKSTDGGDAWTAANRGMLDYRITALAVDPTQSQTVYAGSAEGLFKSVDGGQTWNDLTGGLPLQRSDRAGVHHIAVDPAAPEVVYLFCDGIGALLSHDGGATWQPLGKPLGPDHPVFSAVLVRFGAQPVLIAGVEREGIWRHGADQEAATPPTAAVPESTVALPPLPVGTWQKIEDLPRHINALVTDPANAQVLYAGTGESGSGSGVYKSEDGGLTWHLAANGLPNDDVQALAVSHDGSSTLFAAVGDGIYTSADGASSWALAGNPGMWGGFYRYLYTDPGGSTRQFMIARPGGFVRSLDGGRTWLPIGEGLPGDETEVHVMSLAIDPTDPDVVYVGTGAWVGGGRGVYRSVDGGETWTAVNRGMLDYRITALAVDPADPQTVYAGGDYGELWKSVDGGQSWVDLSEALRTGQRSEPGTIRCIFVDPHSPQIVYLLGDNAGVLVSHDGGTRWRTLGKPGEGDQPSYTTMTVAFDPKLLLVVGVERAGGWRFVAEQ